MMRHSRNAPEPLVRLPDVTNELLSVRYMDEDGGLSHQEGWLGESQGGGKASV
jgi:hypothetical protein